MQLKTAVSWAGAIVALVGFCMNVWQGLQNVLRGAPPLMQQVAHPLAVNPALTPERVWAVNFALSVLGGDDCTAESVRASLRDVGSRTRRFDSARAGDELRRVGLLAGDGLHRIITEALQPVSDRGADVP